MLAEPIEDCLWRDENGVPCVEAKTPLDLEREFGLTQGNIFQGELSLEQLFFLRPVPGWAYYKTPVENLYMCGSATHPGGGIMAAPGRIASQVILKEWKGAPSIKRDSRAQAGN